MQNLVGMLRSLQENCWKAHGIRCWHLTGSMPSLIGATVSTSFFLNNVFKKSLHFQKVCDFSCFSHWFQDHISNTRRLFSRQWEIFFSRMVQTTKTSLTFYTSLMVELIWMGFQGLFFRIIQTTLCFQFPVCVTNFWHVFQSTRD